VIVTVGRRGGLLSWPPTVAFTSPIPLCSRAVTVQVVEEAAVDPWCRGGELDVVALVPGQTRARHVTLVPPARGLFGRDPLTRRRRSVCRRRPAARCRMLVRWRGNTGIAHEIAAPPAATERGANTGGAVGLVGSQAPALFEFPF